MKNDWISYGAVLALSLIWGSSFFLTTIALQAFSPVVIAGGRIVFSLLAILVALLVFKERLPSGRVEWVWCGLLGMFSLMFPFTALAWGQQSVPSSTAAIYVSGGPLFILALSRILLAEAIPLRKWIGFIIGLCGLLWLVGFDAFRDLGKAGQLWGQLACLSASFSYALSAILIRKMPEMPLLTATIGAQTIASLLIIPFVLIQLPSSMPGGAPLLALAVLGLIQTGLAQLLRFHTVRRSGPVFVSVVGYIIPIWAGLIGVLFLDEAFTIRMAIAFGLIFTGLLITRNGAKAQALRP